MTATITSGTAHTLTNPKPDRQQKLPISSEARATTVEQLDNLLDLLAQYRDQLADPAVTLRQIEPLLNTIAAEKEQLSAVLKAMPDGEGLKDILHRTLITTSLEVMKFNRGDYIQVD